MNIPKQKMGMASAFSYIAFFLCLSNTPATVAQEVYLCVWRNPERSMTRIFPEAKDYKTVTREISDTDRKLIESELGFPLLPGQEKQFLYYDMIGKNGDTIGTIIAASQKGEYGIVEFVFGMKTDLTITDIYIQRSREQNQHFKRREFLDLFLGLHISEATNVNKRYTGPETPGTKAVMQGIAKELITFRKLAVEKPDA